MTEIDMAAVFLLCLLSLTFLLGVLGSRATRRTFGRFGRLETNGNVASRWSGLRPAAAALWSRPSAARRSGLSPDAAARRSARPVCQWCGRPMNAGHATANACLQGLDRLLEASVAARLQRTRHTEADIRRLDGHAERFASGSRRRANRRTGPRTWR